MERLPTSYTDTPSVYILSLLNIISKLGTTYFAPSTERPGPATAAAVSPFPTSGPTLIGDSKINDLSGQTAESQLKRQSLECLVSVLQSLVSWSARGNAAPTLPVARTRADSISMPPLSAGLSTDDLSIRGEGDFNALNSPLGNHAPGSGSATPELDLPLDAPSRFENAKQKKTTLLEGIKKFNFKPKRVRSPTRLLVFFCVITDSRFQHEQGIGFLIDTGFIPSREPKDIAHFLLHADGLSKAQIGEYLGEGCVSP